jgi:hypothetical protein
MSQPIHTYIELSGLRLEVIGTYYKGEDASMDSPGEDPSIEIDAILTPKGDDISGLIADYMSLQTAVEELTIQAHIECILCAAEDHADCVRKGEFK